MHGRIYRQSDDAPTTARVTRHRPVTRRGDDDDEDEEEDEDDVVDVRHGVTAVFVRARRIHARGAWGTADVVHRPRTRVSQSVSQVEDRSGVKRGDTHDRSPRGRHTGRSARPFLHRLHRARCGNRACPFDPPFQTIGALRAVLAGCVDDDRRSSAPLRSASRRVTRCASQLDGRTDGQRHGHRQTDGRTDGRRRARTHGTARHVRTQAQDALLLSTRLSEAARLRQHRTDDVRATT